MFRAAVLSLGLTSAAAFAQSVGVVPTITTIAGNGSTPFSGAGGPATSAALGDNSPHNAVVDGNGNTYLALYSQNRVVKIDARTGILTVFAGNGTGSSTGDGGPAANATINGPAGMVLSPTGVMYIADASDYCVRAVNLTTNIISTYAGVCGVSGFSGDGGPATSAHFTHLDGLGLDALGNLYINDVYNNRIREVNAKTGVITTVVGNGNYGYSGDGGLATSASISLAWTVGLDSQGNLYFGDNNNNRIRKVTASTGIITTIGGTGVAGFSGDGGLATNAQINTAPEGPGVAVDARGNVYVNDYNNHRIRKIDGSTGIITTIVGTGAAGFSGDGGPATSATINAPKRVGFDLIRGSVLVSDTGNDRLRRIDLLPVIFPATQVGSSSSTLYYYLQTTAAVAIKSITIPLSQGGVQEFSAGTVTGCTVDGVTVNAAGTVCKIPVTFQPTYSGERLAPLQVVTSVDAANFPLRGAGLASQALIFPGTTSTVAGTGIAGSSGDGGAATSASLSSPNKSVADSLGNIYIADTANNRIRKIATGTGIITTVAGTGQACSAPTAACGDGAAATSATLNAPKGIAVGPKNLYIADSGDNRIRVVDLATGVISTLAGTGVASYTGDEGAASVATFNNPTALAVDPDGNVFVVDSNNNAVRRIGTSTSIITTLAGNGIACSTSTSTCGDGGQASAANLNSPAAIAVDISENVYIADTGDNRIRLVSGLTGLISTVAGSGTAGFSGDGGAAASASLSSPSGIALDSANDLYIADTANNVIRLVNSATNTIQTIAGNTAGCAQATAVCGDSGPSTAANLTAPSGINTDSLGNLYIADTGDNRIREVNPSSLNLKFASTPLGSTSTDSAKSVTILSAGNQPLAFPVPSSGTNAAISNNFSLTGSSTCPQLAASSSGPGSLASGAACTYGVNFTPGAVGTISGSLQITDNNLNTAAPSYAQQTITLNGTGTQATPATTLTSSTTTLNPGQSVTFTDTVPGQSGVSATGTVTFYNGLTAIGTGPVVNGLATLTYAGLPTGVDTITAVYGGDSNFTTSTSNPVIETVAKSSAADTLTTSNAAPNYGQSVTFTDTIPVVGGIAPTGIVSFYNAGTLLGTGSVSSTGVATLATTALPAGTDSITAVYGGDSNYASVTSNSVTEILGKASAPPSAPTVSPANAPYGTSVTLSLTVPTDETGTVAFYSGTTSLGMATINNGVATLVTAALPAGTDSITGQTSGDANYNAAVSPATTDVVSKVTNTIAAPAISPVNSPYGTSVTFTETVPSDETGTVTFFNGMTVLGTATITNGVATLTSTALPAGMDSISAQTSGDSNYNAATSPVSMDNVGKATPTLVAPLIMPLNSPYGTMVTLTQTVPADETGVVTFYVGTTALGTGTITNGTASLTTSALPAGTDLITTQTSGDTNYAGTTSPAAVDIVGKVSGTDMLTTSNTSPLFGQSVTFTYNVMAVNGTTPTGTVTFYDGNSILGTATVGASGMATFTTLTLPVGTDLITAAYSGDSVYASSTAGPVTETVGQANGADSLTTSDASPQAGNSVSFTDTIPVVAGVAPTGTVTFYNGTTVIGTGGVNASGVATLTVGSLPVGSNAITAVYSGDANYASVTAGPITENVARSASPSTLTTSNASIALGQSVTFTNTLPVTGGVPPSGSVTFYSGTTSIGTAMLNASGVATLTTSMLTAGSDSITAVYLGDVNYESTNGGPLTETVAQSNAATTLSSSNASPVYGQSVSFTDTIPVVAGIMPTGTVNFYAGSTLLGTGTVNAAGVATLATTSLSAGTVVVTAVYAGDTNYGQSTSNTVTENVSRVTGSNTLSSSNLSPTAGQPVTLTVMIPAVGGVAPTGTVTFYNGTTSLGTGSVNESGMAVLTTSSLPVGTDSITATYGGDGNYGASTSNTVTETVGKASGANTLTSSNASLTFGQAVTFTNTPSTAGGVAPTGTVTFFSGGAAIGTATLNGSGVASLTISSLPAGTDNVTATFAGDSNYAGSTSNAVIETVSKASSVATLTSATSSTALGQAANFTFSIPSVGGVPATGTVTFYNGSTVIGTGSLNSSGSAVLSTTSLPAGTDSITAVYAGDENYTVASAGPITQTVAQSNSTNTLASSNTNPALGGTVILTDTISLAGSVIPTGTVTFYNGTISIGTATVNSSGVATFSTSSLPVGTDTVTAVYAGDTNYNSGTSNAVTETVAKQANNDVLATAAQAPAFGQPVTFTDTIPITGGVAPTGTVTFYIGTAVIGTGTVNSAGVATLTTGSLPAGSSSIVAVYSGDSVYAASTSNTVTVAVAQAATSSSLSTSSGATNVGQSVTFTDTIVLINGVAPTGTVTFYDGTAAIGSGPVSPSGIATLTTSALSAGTHNITAIYSGDTNYSTGKSNLVSVTVTAPATADFTIAATPSTQTANPGDTLKYTISLGGLTVPFNQSVILSATGLPPGATVSFSPASLVPGAGPTSTTMTLVTLPTQASLGESSHASRITFALLFLPLLGIRRVRRMSGRLPQALLYVLVLLGGLGAVGTLTGCGGGYFGLPPHSYTITVTGTSGSLHHSTSVNLTVR